MAYLWASDATEWTVRFFFTANGALLEDPATGSACANLGGWTITKARAPMIATLRQGDAIALYVESGAESLYTSLPASSAARTLSSTTAGLNGFGRKPM
jgi:hypothetical protein